jgi:hypothetical protein
MAQNYEKMPTRELQQIVNVTPPEMPHAMKADRELTRRIARRGVLVSALISLVSLAVSVIANFEKIAALFLKLF